MAVRPYKKSTRPSLVSEKKTSPTINRPLISIVTPVFNTDSIVLKECIESVLKQSYQVWELCLCNDASTLPATREVLDHYHGKDARIKIIHNSTNLHIADTSNRAALFATGSFLGFLDHDDTLHPDAIKYVVEALSEDQTIDLLYTDEDKLDFNGEHCDPYIKPDWSPEHLLSVMYMLHFLVIRKSLFHRLGGFRTEYTGAQDYDLALRASAMARTIHHVPRQLYHWRMVAGSASQEVDAKPYALDAGQKAVADFVGNTAHVEKGKLPGFFRVRYAIPQNTPVTLLFLTAGVSRSLPEKGNVLLLVQAIESIKNISTYQYYECLVVHNNDLLPETILLLQKLGATVISAQSSAPFNYAERLNFGFSHVKSEFVIVLNDDVEAIQSDWIESLVEWLTDPKIGVVGARLLYPDRTVQHAGIALIPTYGATHPFYRMAYEDIGYNGFTHLIRNVTAVTGAAMGTKMTLVRKVGGFDTALSTDFNDVDFCLKIYAAGYRIVWTPHCELIHYESSSLKRNAQNSYEVELFNSRWAELTEKDPFLDIAGIKKIIPWAIDPYNTVP
jgi:O-antigen biosynthesis protein